MSLGGGRYDLAWLMFNWQFKLLRERRDIKKLYRVSKVAELDREEWDELLSRDDFTVVSFYPNTVEWVKERYGIDLPYIPLGLDPATYDGWTGEAGDVLSIIHSYRERGWHYHLYREAMEGLPTLHVDHLDPDQPVFEYADIQRALRRSRVYLHDGEQEYTITLIEAMMTGMPLVSFRIPGIERYVVHGENGFVGASYPAGASPTALMADDLTGDGLVDILVASLGSGDFRVLSGDGKGSFPGLTGFPGTFGASDAVLQDMDGDGLGDLLIASLVTNRLSLVRNVRNLGN